MNTLDAAQVTILQAKAQLDDPHDCTDNKDVLTILHALYDTLVRRDETGFAPGLATAWTVSADAQRWRFTLRPDARFHDGTRCDASAVVASLRRMARPDKGYTLGAPGVWHQYLGTAEISADGPETVVISLQEPLADLLDVLVQGFIVAPGYADALDAGQAPLPCGSGPYRVTSVAPGMIQATRVDDHPRRGGPDRVTWQAEPDPIVRRDAVSGGEAQVATGLTLDRYATPMPHRVIPYENPVAIIYLLNAARGPFADARLRRALNLALDRPATIEAARGGAGQALYALMPGVSLGAGAMSSIEQDVAKVRQLISEAGYADGLTLQLDCPTRLPDEAEAMTAELARQLKPLKIALDVMLHQDREAYAHMVRRKEIGDLCVFDSSPLSTFRVLYEKIDARIGGSWWQGYHNPEVEARLDTARATVDIGARAQIYAEILQLLQDDPPWLTLYTPMQAIALGATEPGDGFTMPADGVLDVTALPHFSQSRNR